PSMRGERASGRPLTGEAIVHPLPRSDGTSYDQMQPEQQQAAEEPPAKAGRRKSLTECLSKPHTDAGEREGKNGIARHRNLQATLDSDVSGKCERRDGEG